MKENTIDDIIDDDGLQEFEDPEELDAPLEAYKFTKVQMEWIERSRKISRIICELSD